MNDWDLKIALARLDERVKALSEEVERTERFNERALEIASTGLDKHLVTLNGHTADMRAAQELHARNMLSTQALLQTKDVAARDKGELDERLKRLEGAHRELSGRGSQTILLWTVLVAVIGVIATLIALFSGR